MTNDTAYPGEPIDALAIGTLIEVDGTRIVAELDAQRADLTRVYNGTAYPIGQFGSILKIHFGRKLLYAYVSRLRMKADFDRERGITVVGPSQARVIEADLFGEAEWVRDSDGWELEFERGVSTFPLPQQRVFLTPRAELTLVFGRGNRSTIQLGEIVGSGGTPFYLDIDELLGKHTAVLGSTGAGKSGTVAYVLHALLDHGVVHSIENWSPTIVILDPHNEYGDAFRDSHLRCSTDEGSLLLPYWMLDLDETVSLFVGHSERAATSLTNILKVALLESRREGASLIGLDRDRVTVDSPVPYVLGDPSGLDHFGCREGALDLNGLVGFINRQRPADSRDKSKHEEFSRLIRRLDALCRDSRLTFMMSSWSYSQHDPLQSVMAQFIGGTKPIRIVDFSGVPNEIAGTASSAIARLLFNAKVWQTPDERRHSPVLLVCEEAHRYMPNTGEAQYAAARQAIQRIAKEGRKYGIGVMLVSQRPSELDATVLSQCNSWIVLRISNDADRAHIRAVLPDSLAGLSKVLSGLRQREVIVVGQAATVPARVRVEKLAQERRPNSHDIRFVDGWSKHRPSEEHLAEVGLRWRFQERPPSEKVQDAQSE